MRPRCETRDRHIVGSRGKARLPGCPTNNRHSSGRSFLPWREYWGMRPLLSCFNNPAPAPGQRRGLSKCNQNGTYIFLGRGREFGSSMAPNGARLDPFTGVKLRMVNGNIAGCPNERAHHGMMRKRGSHALYRSRSRGCRPLYFCCLVSDTDPTWRRD